MSADKKADIELKSKSIMAMLVKFNSLFSKHQREAEEVLLSWSNYLASRNFTVKQVGFALTELTKKGLVFMPSAHEIVGVLIPSIEPKEYRAERIATEIHEAILDTLSGRKTNFTDEMASDTKGTVDVLGGYRVLKETDFNKDFNRARLVKSAMAVLILAETNARNAKLATQGISCVAIASLDLQNIEELPPGNIQFVSNRTGQMQTFTATVEDIQKTFKEIRESLPMEGDNNATK